MSIEGASSKNQPVRKGAAIGAGMAGVIGAGVSASKTVAAKGVALMGKDEFSSIIIDSFKNGSESAGKVIDESAMAEAKQFGEKMFDIFKNIADHPIKAGLKTTGKIAAVGLAIGAAIGGVVALVKNIKHNKAKK